MEISWYITEISRYIMKISLYMTKNYEDVASMRMTWSLVLVQRRVGVGLLIVLVSDGSSSTPLELWMANKNCGSLYYNYIWFHSIVLLSLINGDYKFIWADIGANGSASNAQVFMIRNLGTPSTMACLVSLMMIRTLPTSSFEMIPFLYGLGR